MRKKTIFIPGVIVMLIAGGILGAQEAPARTPPEEDPQDLFPSVVLEIEDLSVEKIDAGLPREPELAAFEREAPLPGPGEIRLSEPAVDSLLPGTGEQAADGRSFFAAALFGAGLNNNLLTEINFFRLGLQPVIRLLFAYESLDGFAGRQVGLGNSERRDRFEGSIKFKNDIVSLAAAAGFRERELGLQEETVYYSVNNQFSFLDASVSAAASDVFTVSLSGKGSVTGFNVTGAAHPGYAVDYPPTEFLGGGVLRGDFRWPQARVGLAVGYAYRNIAGDEAYLMHRFRAAADAAVDFSDRLTAEAEVSVFSSSQIEYLIPFRVAARAVPVDWLTLNLGGGYRVRESDLAVLLPRFDFADFPAAIRDNHGWYADASAQISVESTFLLVVKAALAENRNYPALSRTADPVTGLFPIVFGDGVTNFELDCRAKLPLFAWLGVDAFARFDLPFTPGYYSSVELGGELTAEDVGGAFGVKVTLSLRTGFTSAWEFPYLDAGAFVRVLDNMKFMIEGLDLLQPLMGGTRYSPAPYAAPGIRARFKIQISL